MSDTNTSAEEVERLATEAEARADMYSVQHGIGARNARETAATLRALLAERDAAKLQAAEAVVALNNRDRERMQAEREARAAEAERDRLREALIRAKGFIVNGVELGFIRMPDPGTPDPAHETLPAIIAALGETGHD